MIGKPGQGSGLRCNVLMARDEATLYIDADGRALAGVVHHYGAMGIERGRLL